MHAPRPFDPCKGFRVLDLSRLYPGPMCTLVLARLGAEVVKVEDPAGGDYLRYAPPLVDGTSALFHALNRGKKGITLDLKDPAGRDALLALAADADAVVESNRPGVMDRLGLGFDALCARNPRIVLCSLTGYGQTGPLAQDAAHDINLLAMTGALFGTGPRGGAPVVPSVQIADVATGLYAAMALCAAIPEARAAGRPRWIDVSMVESALSLSMLEVAISAVTGADTRPAEGVLNGGAAVYGVYETADGRHEAVGALEEKFQGRLFRALGLPAGDLMQGVFSNGGPAADALAAAFKAQTRAEHCERFAGVDACVTPVLRPSEVPSCTHLNVRGAFDRGSVPGVPLAELPLMETGGGRAPLGAAPGLGEHNREILGSTRLG